MAGRRVGVGMNDTVVLRAPTSGARTQLAVAMTASMLVALDVAIVNVAAAPLRHAFLISSGTVQWVLTLYTLVFASLLLNAGALCDRWGARRTFLIGFALFTLASLACGAAPAWPALLIARAGQGAGAALLTPATLSIIQAAYPERGDRARAIGWWSAAGSAALAAGPVLGGALVHFVGWRSIFLLNLPIGALGLWAGWRHIPRSESRGGRSLDMPGQVLGAAALACFALAVGRAGANGWPASTALAVGGLGCCLSAAFIVVERRSSAPMVPAALFSVSGFALACFAGGALNFLFYGLLFVLSLTLQAGRHFDALGAGWLLAPMMLSLIVTNGLAGRFERRLGSGRVIGLGLVCAAAGAGTLAATANLSGVLGLIGGSLMLGVGAAMASPATVALALSRLPSSHIGTGSGVLNAARQIGGALGISVFAALLSKDPSDVSLYRDCGAVGLGIGLFAGAAVLLGTGLSRADAINREVAITLGPTPRSP